MSCGVSGSVYSLSLEYIHLRHPPFSSATQGLPYAVREAGFVTGLLLLVILGVVTDWTIRL